jgi:ubiquinone/menaquinone biosynthesis C-methylase UbiE
MYPPDGRNKDACMDHDIGSSQEEKILLQPAAAYDLAADAYDGWSWQSFWRKTETPFFDTCIEAHPEERRHRLLDAGCGTGFHLDRYGILFAESFGVDPSAGMLAKAADKCPGSRVIIGTADSMSFFVSAAFDVVICARILSHVEDIESVILELARVTAPGGMLLLSNVDASHPYSVTRLPTGAGDVFADTFKHARDDVLKALAAAGFTVSMTGLVASDGGMLTGMSSFSETDEAMTAWTIMASMPMPTDG